MNYFDANTWIGRWPFAFCDAHTPRSLIAQLKKSGIRRALVSPLDAVFAPEPGPANEALLRQTRGVTGLEPVPVINPALANWREELLACGKDVRVRAVRLLPTYHNYRLQVPVVEALVLEAARLELRVIVQVRLIDERHEYHALNLKAVPLDDLEAFSKTLAPGRVMLSGLLGSEILALLPKRPHLVADLSFAEWHDTLSHLLAKVAVRQLVFASHTPFLITAAAREKMQSAQVAIGTLRAIAGENLKRFLA
ncbi:MAG: hypothetical protein ABIZ04_08235 [Opitutus sp.]